MLTSALAPRWAVLAVGIPLCLLLQERKDTNIKRLPYWLLLVLCAMAVPTLWAQDQFSSLDELIHFAILAGAFYLGAQERDLTPAWLGIAAGVNISAVLALWQMLGWADIEQAIPPAGLFMNKNMFAEAGMVSLVALLALGKRYYLLLPGTLVATILPASRAVYGALLITLAVMWSRKRPYLSATAFLLVLVAAVTSFIFMRAESASLRLEYWAAAVSHLSWLGHGANSFSALVPSAWYAHSEPVQLAYEFGVLALPLFVLVIYALGGPHGPERLVLFAVVAVGLLSFPLRMPLTGFAAALAAGHLVAGRFDLRGHKPVRGMAGALYG